MINDREDKKQAMLKNFNVSYLEDMLNSSTKSVAREVVSTLVKQGEAGTLQILERKHGSDDFEDADNEKGHSQIEQFNNPLKQKNNWSNKKSFLLDRSAKND